MKVVVDRTEQDMTSTREAFTLSSSDINFEGVVIELLGDLSKIGVDDRRVVPSVFAKVPDITIGIPRDYLGPYCPSSYPLYSQLKHIKPCVGRVAQVYRRWNTITR